MKEKNHSKVTEGWGHMMYCVSVLAGLTFIVLLSKHQQPNITIGSCHSKEYGRHTHCGMIINNY